MSVLGHKGGKQKIEFLPETCPQFDTQVGGIGCLYAAKLKTSTWQSCGEYSLSTSLTRSALSQ